ncbi:MAG: hypothetical protein HF314_06670 [Ignavibacteria bacterium]|jgi:hypothetical protein|nr:hypothetical protein [Ignavibacteria bacterium]MCU7502739.1 hypothetical protein [Ignavibacteria bacterium]MCU7517332.1 hypothetical protein [Ignavibacteria bacterium]
MEEIQKPEEIAPNRASEANTEEPGHSDKVAGIFAGPAQTYEQMAKFPPRIIDWLLPTFLVVVIAVISNIILMSNPDIRYQAKEKQMAGVEKTFNKMVEGGQISREVADGEIEKARDKMDSINSGMSILLQSISTVFAVFISFFIVTGIYFLFSRFLLKGDGTYQSALSANGMSHYISIVGMIAMVLVSLLLRKFLMGTSLGAFIDADKATFTGMLLYKLDIIGIWGLAITSIGLAKMFHSVSVWKYFTMVFGIWIIWSLITLAIARAVPLLSSLAM